MKRDVKVEVTSSQKIDGESVTLKSTGQGVYNSITGLLSYLEEMEDGVRVLTTIRITEEGIMVRKSGGIISEMPFVAGTKTAGIYRTSYSEHELEIKTDVASHNSEEKHERIILKYSLAIDGQHIGYTEMDIIAIY